MFHALLQSWGASFSRESSCPGGRNDLGGQLLKSLFAQYPPAPYNRSFIPNPMIHFPVPEALTFDDVLLLPARSEVVPAQRQHADPAHAQYPPEHSHHQRRHGHGHRIAHGDCAGAAGRPRDYSSQPDHRAAGQRSGQGEALGERHDRRSRSPCRPTPRFPTRSKSCASTRFPACPSRKDGKLVGILTNRDLRFETRFDIPISKVMTKKNLITVPVGTTLEASGKDSARASRGKASGRRRQVQPEGPDHG